MDQKNHRQNQPPLAPEALAGRMILLGMFVTGLEKAMTSGNLQREPSGIQEDGVAPHEQSVWAILGFEYIV